jgi:single-stranded-DNA-specific exonuclease
MLGIAVSYRIPHRIQDGYGMKSYFFDELAEKNVKLVISVDCGTRDIAAIRHAKSLGIDVIVTDHHAVPDSIHEEAVALISPKLRDTTYPFHGLSGS